MFLRLFRLGVLAFEVGERHIQRFVTEPMSALSTLLQSYGDGIENSATMNRTLNLPIFFLASPVSTM